MLSDQDRKLWGGVLRSVDPLPGRIRPPTDSSASPAPSRSSYSGLRPQAVNTILDLHGMTIELAHRQVLTFLERSQRSGLRRVLVVTGRSGPIRREFPQWIEAPSFDRLVRSIHACPKERGGDGAFQVSLRYRTGRDNQI